MHKCGPWTRCICPMPAYLFSYTDHGLKISEHFYHHTFAHWLLHRTNEIILLWLLQLSLKISKLRMRTQKVGWRRWNRMSEGSLAQINATGHVTLTACIYFRAHTRKNKHNTFTDWRHPYQRFACKSIIARASFDAAKEELSSLQLAKDKLRGSILESRREYQRLTRDSNQGKCFHIHYYHNYSPFQHNTNQSPWTRLSIFLFDIVSVDIIQKRLKVHKPLLTTVQENECINKEGIAKRGIS